MSTSTTPPAQRGWTEGRARRARMFAVLLAVCAAVGLWATSQPWFAWATPGLAASCEVAPAGAPTITVIASSGVSIEGVAARGCMTGMDVVASDSSPVGTAAGVTAAQGSLKSVYGESTPDALLGMPRTTAVLVLCLGVAVFGVVTRRGYLPAIALLVMQVAHRDLGSLRTSFLTDPASELTRAMPGLQYYTWAVLFGSALTFAVSLFVLKVNFEERKEQRRLARAAGEDEPREPLDLLTDYLGRKISKVKAATAEADQHAAMVS